MVFQTAEECAEYALINYNPFKPKLIAVPLPEILSSVHPTSPQVLNCSYRALTRAVPATYSFKEDLTRLLALVHDCYSGLYSASRSFAELQLPYEQKLFSLQDVVQDYIFVKQQNFQEPKRLDELTWFEKLTRMIDSSYFPQKFIERTVYHLDLSWESDTRTPALVGDLKDLLVSGTTIADDVVQNFSALQTYLSESSWFENGSAKPLTIESHITFLSNCYDLFLHHFSPDRLEICFPEEVRRAHLYLDVAPTILEEFEDILLRPR